MAISFGHTADLHLRNGEPGQPRLQALEQIVADADRRQLDFLLIAGDLFDRDSENADLIVKARTLFARHPELPVFIIPGNHDPHIGDHPPFLGQQVRIIHQQPMEVITLSGEELPRHPADTTVTICGVPFANENRCGLGSQLPWKQMTTMGKDIQILMLHAELYDERFLALYKAMMAAEEGNQYCPVALKDLEEAPFHYIALGHYHDFFVSPDGRISYSGAPCALSRRLRGPRSYNVVTLEPRDNSYDVSIEPHVLDMPYWLNVSLYNIFGEEKATFTTLDHTLTDLTRRDRSACHLLLDLAGYVASDEKKFRTHLDQLCSTYRNRFASIVIGRDSLVGFAHGDHYQFLNDLQQRLAGATNDDALRQRAFQMTVSALHELKL